jgi:ribonuclease HI
MDNIKINLDGAFREDTHSGGWGAIARDSAGDTVFAAAGRVSVAADALHTELLALVNVIPIAESQGIGKIISSTDCLVLKQAMETSSYDFSSLGQLLLHAKFMLSTSFIQSIFEYVPRICTRPAHELAALGARGDTDSHHVWMEILSPDVTELVASDIAVP